ncbi:MAG TPA: LPS export ABC transporter periplasmic protein LptC [Sulfurimonas sp. UBA10385]|uniref:LPS export ABC transporter periplasmic protein LptC n=1 Tax=unclassified Sulfurimonas TaxID=2623549 RepID=UPI000C624401|nr:MULTISPECIES: LPS export ABC transporter periplasmic protein LptC [unclassified Sulfurimonas]DAB28261.1 MAG TPA: LPS export ABC transporter periplasmic protein LptC [Sulfurimonas sp. UBA10385]
MNINHFFAFLFISLLMILLLFKPMDIKQQSFTDVPSFSISSFIMYELNSKGLITLMNGDKATKYANRYEVERMNYTDNSKEYIANMKSNTGVYKNNTVYLDGDIIYSREDGLTFKTQKAVYNKKTTVATVDGSYVLYRDANIVTGEKLKYNNSLETLESKNIKAIYQLEESN